MRILLAHNDYLLPGGEDVVFQLEKKLLLSYDNEIDEIIISNQQITNTFSKLVAGIKSLYNPATEKLLKAKITKFKPDVIHVHNFFPLLSPSIFYAAAKNNIPVVLTLHNYRLICSNALFLRNEKVCTKCLHKRIAFPAIYHRCYRNSHLQSLASVMTFSTHNLLKTWNNKIDKFIVLSNFAKKKFVSSKININEDNIIVKPNFVYDQGISQQKRQDFYLYVGRLSKEKGIDVMLNAFSQIDYKVKIIGDGPFKDKVEEFVKKRDNIEYLGYLDRTEIYNQLKISKALISPSIIFEGLPLTIIESFSTGTPVITSDIGAMGEMVNDGVDGLKFKVNDSSSLIQKLRQFEEELSGSDLVYKNARDAYVKNYSPENNYDQLLRIYKLAINAKKKNHSA